MKKVLIASLIFLMACDSVFDGLSDMTIDRISGNVQKGPFRNGTSVTISSLDENMTQTGLSFNTSVTDNMGSFLLEDVTLNSAFAEVRADGFYLNEVSGEIPQTRLILTSIVDLRDAPSLNVNVVTHLEKDRAKALVQEGLSLQEAKKQAQQEIMRVFELESSDDFSSHELNIATSGEGHGKLLAISIILQGFRSVAELTELLGNFNADFSSDGILNDSTIGSDLVSQAALLDLASIRKNLEAQYEEMNADVTIPEFESAIQSFTENSGFDRTSIFTYPEEGLYGINILSPETKLVSTTGDYSNPRVYSLRVEKPAGTAIRVKLEGWEWRFDPTKIENWSYSNFNFDSKSQLFTARKSANYADMELFFARVGWGWSGRGPVTVSIFEGEASEPSIERTFQVVN